MAVIHIMKDGTRLDDITGHVVRFEDAEPLYRMLASWSTKRPEAPKKKTSRRPTPATIHNSHAEAQA